jgi:hypothetical protein
MNIKESIAAAVSITITLASLGSASAQECTAIDNSSNLYLDALLYLSIKLQNSAPGGEKCIKVFFYASHDGTNYTDNATGSNAAVTLRSPTNLVGPYIIQTPTADLTYKVVIPVAQFFGGVLPKRWGFVIYNASGVTLSATEGDHTKEYAGVFQTVT